MSKKFLDECQKHLYEVPAAGTEKEKKARLLLSLIPYVGPARFFALLEAFKSAEVALLQPPLSLAEAGLSLDKRFLNAWETFRFSDLADREKELASREGISILTAGSDDYPAVFYQLPDPPPVVFIKGESIVQKRPTLGIIGTRNCSLASSSWTEEAASDLAASGITIISGLARGIDTAAHKGALQSGKTWAVLGSGFGHLYPKENTRLAEKILDKGALITESPYHTSPSKMLFPRRNRLVAALSQSLLVVEAPKRSGALITTDWGRRLGRKIFAVPGRVDTGQFEGSHFLLKEKRAVLVEKSCDLLKQLNIEEKKEKPKRLELSPPEKEILDIIGRREVSQEELLSKLSFPPGKLQAYLMKLVMKKVLLEYPGKVYKKSFSFLI